VPALRVVETVKALPPGPEVEPAGQRSTVDGQRPPEDLPADLAAAVEHSLARRIVSVVRHLAFALGLLLAVAVVVIAVLVATGTI
jgi:hypothetical protein